MIFRLLVFATAELPCIKFKLKFKARIRRVRPAGGASPGGSRPQSSSRHGGGHPLLGRRSNSLWTSLWRRACSPNTGSWPSARASSRSASVVDGLDPRNPRRARVLCGSTYVVAKVKVSTLAGLLANLCFTPVGRRIAVMRRPAHQVSKAAAVMGRDRW